MEIALISKARNGPMIRHRELQDLTQAKAAKEAKVSLPQWAHLERLEFDVVSFNTLCTVADYLGLHRNVLCPPELRKYHVHLDRTNYHLIEASRLMDGRQAHRLCLPDPAEEVQRKIDDEIRKEQLRIGLNKLTPRQRQIVVMRYGLNGYAEYTFKELARIFCISLGRVSEICNGATRKLSKYLDE